MRPREAGAAITGIILFSAILTSAVTQDIPLDFFINPETGEPNAIIVVSFSLSILSLYFFYTVMTREDHCLAEFSYHSYCFHVIRSAEQLPGFV